MPIVNIMKEHELQNAYIGGVIECDFTKSDCGFIFVGRTSPQATYGRDLNGFYVTCTFAAAVSWRIPSSIYSKGTVEKIEFLLSATEIGCGGGITQNTDSPALRVWNSVIENSFYQYGTANLGGTTPISEHLFTIDLENSIAYDSSYPSVIYNIPSGAVSEILDAWANGQLNIIAMRRNINSASSTSYIKKATFYF